MGISLCSRLEIGTILSLTKTLQVIQMHRWIHNPYFFVSYPDDEEKVQADKPLYAIVLQALQSSVLFAAGNRQMVEMKRTE
jgi:hypothetical protein